MLTIKNNSEIISVAISLIALLLSLYSVIKSNKINRFEITISNVEYEAVSDKIRINFSLFNNSVKSVLIENIKFYSTKTQKQQLPASFDISAYYEIKNKQNEPKPKPQDPLLGNLPNAIDISRAMQIPEYPQDYEYSSDTTNLRIKPNEYLNLTYYFDKIYLETTVKIKANEKISYFSKEKSFPVILIKSE